MSNKQAELGATSIEYALLAALIALAILGGLNATGTQTGNLWEYWTAKVMAVFVSAGG